MSAIALALLAAVAAAPAMPALDPGVTDDAYGQVVLDQFSTAAGMPAVTFDHWLHRARYTCRVCHADVAFALRAGETRVSAETIRGGLHCGACHGRKVDGKVLFAACSESGKPAPGDACDRCHTGRGASPARERYEAFAASMPRDRGGFVDWDAAEAKGLVKPRDFVEGVSIERPAMRIDRDVPIRVRGTWLGPVTFSHKKHAAWNGCEICHPEIFPVTKSGAARYDMAAIRAGRYCGACHVSVAFPVSLCPRCHAIQ